MVESTEAQAEDEPPPRLLFRRALHSDISSIVSIENACFNSESFNERQFKYMLRSPSSIAIVAQRDGGIAGYVWAYVQRFGARKLGRIYSLAVKPEFRGRGIAGNLLSMVEQEMRLLNVDRLFLEVEEFNVEALELYGKMGFEVQSFLPDYYGDEGSALKMVKKLVYQ